MVLFYRRKQHYDRHISRLTDQEITKNYRRGRPGRRGIPLLWELPRAKNRRLVKIIVRHPLPFFLSSAPRIRGSLIFATSSLCRPAWPTCQLFPVGAWRDVFIQRAQAMKVLRGAV